MQKFNNVFKMSSALKEVCTNSLASDFVVSHYEYLKRYIRFDLGIRGDKVNDLLHDVYVSLYKSESMGNPFDPTYHYGEKENATVSTIQQFVMARIKAYSRNEKYRSDVIETKTIEVYSSRVVKCPVVKNGAVQIEDGHVMTKNQIVTEKVVTKTSAVAATFTDCDGDIKDSNDGFQMAYAMAASSDCVDEVTDLLSMQEQIEYCIDICSSYDVDIVHILQNMDRLSCLLKDAHERHNKKVSRVFDKLRALVQYHDDFAEALYSILETSKNHRSEFEHMLAMYA